MINGYKAVESMLYNYKAMQVEIKNINLELEELKYEYEGCKAVTYEEKSSPTYKFNSNVENEVVKKDCGPDKLENRKHKLKVQLEKIDNALEILDDREHEIVTLRYFNKVSNQDIARKLNLTEQWVCDRKSNIVKRLIPLILIN